MRVRTYCFPGCFTRPPGIDSQPPLRNDHVEACRPQGFSLSVGPFSILFIPSPLPPPSIAGSERSNCGACALNENDTAPSHLGCSPPLRLREEISVASERRASQPLGLALCGSVPRRGGLRSAPNGGQEPPSDDAASPQISRQACSRSRPRPPSLGRCRPPSAWCCAPGARPIARPSRSSTPIPRSCASSATAPRSRAPRATRCSTPSRPMARARLRPVVRGRPRGPRRVPGLRRAGRAVVPARRAASRRGRLAPGAPGLGARARHRGCARVAAPRLRGARPGRGDLDHRPGQRALDPRRAEARHAPRGRSPAPSNGPPTERVRDFFARCGIFTGALLTCRESARIRSVQTRNRAAESEALGLRGPPL